MSRLWLRRLEWLLVGAGIGCLATVGYVWFDAERFQRTQVAAFEAALPPPEPRPALETAGVEAGGVVGLLSMPRLGIETTVVEGDDDAALQRSAGHLPDTPLPWEDGNSAIAAHRDGLFRGLRNVKVGDEIRLRTRRGELVYTVRQLSIVAPDDLSVLEPREPASVTLITCYPFSFIGHAPKRFIVRAERMAAVINAVDAQR